MLIVNPKVESVTKKQKQYINKSKNLEGAIITELKKQGYGIISADVRINSKEKFIPLEILVTEKRVKEIKGVVQQILKEKHLSNFTIKFYRIDPVKEEADKRWRPVIDAITTGLLGEKDYKVKSVGYSFYPSPLTLTIKTTINSTDPNAKVLALKIEKTIQNFIKSDEVKEKVKKDPYKIKIYSNDHKKIN